MKIAFLTSGGIAPCLSASIGRLTENYLRDYPKASERLRCQGADYKRCFVVCDSDR